MQALIDLLEVRKAIHREIGRLGEHLREIVTLIDGTAETVEENINSKPVDVTSHREEVIQAIRESGDAGLLVEQICEQVFGRMEHDLKVSVYNRVVQPLLREGVLEIVGIRNYRIRSLQTKGSQV